MGMLSDPSEQSRLLEDLPEVIADIEELEPAVHDSATEDRSECNSLPDTHIPQTPKSDLGMSSHPTSITSMLIF